MDPNDQNLFVIASIEDANLTAFGHPLGGSPEKVMVQLSGRRLFETKDLTARGIEATKHCTDCAIFARRIHRLKHQKQRLTIFCEEDLLQGIDSGYFSL